MVEVQSTSSQVGMVTEKLHHLLLGGDQLTAERARGHKVFDKTPPMPQGSLKDIYQHLKTGMLMFADMFTGVLYYLVTHCTLLHR